LARTRNALWLTALGALALLLLALSPLRLAGEVEARGGTLLLPVSGALQDAFRPLAEVVLHAGQLQQLAIDNASLRQQLAALEAEAATLREQRGAAEQERALQAAVGDTSGHLAAAVIVHDPAPGRRGVVIDRGATDGVRTGQPVLGPGAILVGVVVETQDRRARVRLLDDPHSAVAAVVQQSRTAGALAGTTDGLRLEFVANGAAVAAGDLVLSSPLGGQLPAGLLIGRLGSVGARAEDLFDTIAVEPLTDFDRLEHVLVVTAFTPDGAPTPDKALP
jgi:rod shape-determining protein MreC